MTDVGFVGLGSMGAPMAYRLLHDHRMSGTNRTRAKADSLIKDGMTWRDTPREVAAASDVVVSMVTDDGALEAITAGPDGIIAGLRPGAVYVDMSTVSPKKSREVAARVRAAGATMLDAPVSGSVPVAEKGELTIMVGGPQDAFETVKPVLERLGTVDHIGDNGQGLLLKLAVNISLGAQMLAFSEGLLLAERGGIAKDDAVRLMTSSAIGSPMLQARADLVLAQPDEAWFSMSQLHKDIRFALEAAREEGVPVPATAAVDRTLDQAEDAGLQHRDIVGFFKVLDQATESTTRPSTHGTK